MLKISKNLLNINDNIYSEHNFKKKFIKFNNETKDKGIVFIRQNTDLDLTVLKDVIKFVCSYKQYSFDKKYSLNFIFNNVNMKDKLTLNLLECVFFELITTYGYTIRVNYSIPSNIISDEVNFSALRFLGDNEYSVEKFKRKFIYSVTKDTYRKIVPRHKRQNDNTLSKLLTDLQTFLSRQVKNSIFVSEISRVVSELVGNAVTHGESDCLIDLHVTTPTYGKQDNTDDANYYGINISIINFSDILFSDKVKSKILKNAIFSGRYEARYYALKEAYKFHKKHFTPTYKEVDFWNLAAMQNNISGRPSVNAGGKGLQDLIKSLQLASENDICYLLSGNRRFDFKRNDYASIDEEWFGANDKHDFLSALPTYDRFSNVATTLNGTAYNLSFVMKEEINEGN
ncbi:hypothetical protein [Weissella paramesenteroides]|uniref:hypothetical protein n=1 Tax=Weissella paramesenteroides TaxID=1249 RepID=UPI00123B1682|nr:hypothetical protein [Weissella paramesenteroides]KAA8446951.1 hypothetical protein FKV72_03930 [Weissella paramesenteroides]KAA8450587.1 hypothetical protein FKV71_08620 [Weissella paramesenteroides]